MKILEENKVENNGLSTQKQETKRKRNSEF